MREGYKMTKFGEIPLDWKVVKIGDIARSFAGGTPRRNVDKYYNGNIPWIKSGEVDNSNICTSSEYVTELAIKETSTRLIESPAILVALYGATAGKVGVLKINACSNQAVLAIKPDNERSDNTYIYYFLKKSTEELLQMTQGSGQPNLSKSIIDKLKVLLPPLQEQKKIAQILSTVDEKIDLTQSKIETTQALKKGLMQQLLTKGIGHTEFKESKLGEIPLDWEVVKIGDIARSFAGGTPRRNVDKYYNGNIPWIKSGEVDNSNICTSSEYVTELAIKETSTRLIESPAILVALYGATAGKVGVLKINACSNQAVLAIKPDNERSDNTYIYYFLKKSTEELLQMTQGSGQPNLSKSIIDKLKVLLPPLQEQKKIAEILSKVDEKIDLLVEKKKAYQAMKKGLMQQLLTGQVRVG